jgi:type III secretion protein J
MFLLLALAACGNVEMFANLNEREANEVIALLLRNGISADKVAGKQGAVAVHVQRDRIPDAVELLNRAGLPRERFANMGELFRREGLISSPSEERVRYMFGVTQELSRTLNTIDGVLSARVHVVMPNNDPLQTNARPASAAVMIRFVPGSPVEASVPQVKELVVNSIEGLSYDRVSVVLVRAAEDADSPAPAMPAPALSQTTVIAVAAVFGVSLLLNLVLVALFLLGRRASASRAVRA